jgi:hypothetical protein
MIMPKLEYPAVFDDTMVCLKVTKPINHMEMMIAVPYKLAITHTKALECENMRKIVEENPEEFGSNEKNFNEDFIMTIFLMYEW